MALIRHREAPPLMVAEPTIEMRQGLSWEDVSTAISKMDDVLFLIVLNRRKDVDFISDPDALMVEYSEICGFMLYQGLFFHDHLSKPWRSKPPEDIRVPSTVTIEDVLGVASSFCSGASFKEIDERFPHIQQGEVQGPASSGLAQS